MKRRQTNTKHQAILGSQTGRKSGDEQTLDKTK